MKKLNKIVEILLILLPSILFFSYHPNISLGSTDSMHLDLSLPLISLALVSLFSLPLLPKIIKNTPKKALVALAIIPCYTIFSLIWSSNPLRTFLSAGVLICLAITILVLPYIAKNTPKFVSKTSTIFLATATAVSIFAWLQSILDFLGVSREVTLLCEGCTYQSFGFPHPNSFAIEPQFFGNLLLAPSFLCLYYILYHKKGKKSILPCPLLWAIAIFLIITLFFTFSRGAIYAFLASIACLTIYQLFKKHYKYLILIPVILCCAIFSLICQGVFAEISPTTDTFTSAITKSIHHLSLGKIDLRVNLKEEKCDTMHGQGQAADVSSRDLFCDRPLGRGTKYGQNTIGGDPVTTGVATGAREGTSEPEPVGVEDADEKISSFDGYVEDSTNIRLELNEMALDTWNDSPRNIFLGAGLGGAGPVLYQKFPDLGTEKQIVQNEYFSLLLEFGLVGIAIIIAAAILIVTSIKIKDKSQKAWLLTLLFAYAITLLFFSGLPNALHIYLLPFYATLFSKHQFLINGKIKKHNH
ncbi:O-antigen ligase family protein [Candidatus Saccharibacteria bacterium]|nr:O-antigen ligase family protein [Candidatus Saccharibacteria bacterium]